MAPKFQHDCERCRFIGHFHGHDIYTCPAPDGLNRPATVLARYGNEGHEYASTSVADLRYNLVEDFRCIHSSDNKIHTGEPIPYQVAMTMGFAYQAAQDLEYDRTHQR